MATGPASLTRNSKNADEKLEEGDLRVTTDYRQILAEVLEKRLHNAATERVFPGLSAQPLGIVA